MVVVTCLLVIRGISGAEVFYFMLDAGLHFTYRSDVNKEVNRLVDN